jgi:hypothetical protein
MSLLFDSAFTQNRTIAPIQRRSAVPSLRKEALARTPGLFSSCGLVLMAQWFGSVQMPDAIRKFKIAFRDRQWLTR